MRWIIFFMPFSVMADQISYSQSSRITDTNSYYSSFDQNIQYNKDVNNNYVFVSLRKAGVCPYYCGFNYWMIGIGYGKSHKIGIGSLFAQVGYYYVDNSVGRVKYNENLYYYLNSRFASFDNPKEFALYEVKNKKHNFGVTVGTEVPLGNNFGIKASYHYIKVKEVITGYFTDPPEGLNLWWDPVNRDLSTINLGIYYNFN